MTAEVSRDLAAALRLAVEHHRHGRWAAAEQQYRLILQTDAQHPDANHNLGQLAMQFGRFDVGISFIRRAAQARSDIDQFWLSYREALLTGGNRSDAKEFVIQGLIDCFAAKRYSDMEGLARHMTLNWPDDGFGWKALGTALCLQDRYPDALPVLQEAARLLPENAETFHSLGNAYRQLGMQQEAHRCYTQAIVLAPEYQDAYSRLSDTLCDMGRAEEGFHARCQAIRLNTSTNTTTPPSNGSSNIKDEETAHARCREALGVAPAIACKLPRKPWHEKMNRYLLCKGWEGFCDRLQSLSNCVSLAARHRRIIFVDWNDAIWSHDSGGFYRYFDLVNLPYVTSLEKIQPGLEVIPSFWRHGLDLPMGDWIYRFKGSLIHNDRLNFTPIKSDLKKTLWVHSCTGFRSFDLRRLANHLRLSREAAQAIAPLLTNVSADLPVVHLRGTDRQVDDAQWRHLRETAPLACVVSDDARLVQRWLDESPDSLVLSDTLLTSEKGGHKLSADEIAQHGYDKFQMNIRLLADFLVLANAREAYALNENSVFFKMARRLHKHDGVGKLLCPAPPPTVMNTDQDGYTFSVRISEAAE